MRIQLPGDGWYPRPYQDRCWTYLVDRVRAGQPARAVPVWHRRAGKDKLCLNFTALAAHIRPGVHWHMLPEASQARKAIWDAVDEFTGVRLIDQAFPMAIRATTRESDMFIRFHNGATWQVVGSDNFNSLIGSPPIGVVFSEFAYANPGAWQKLSPILLNNGGWAIFPSTPFGRNHFYGLHEYAKTAPGWFTEVLTVADTGLFTHEQIVEEERQLAAQRGTQEAQAIIQQEYYCSFVAAIPGAYYGQVLEDMERSEPPRITIVPPDPGFLVETWWDLGIRDDTAIWFVQRVGREFRVIDYYESAGEGIDHYAQVLRGNCPKVSEADNARRARYNYGDIPAVLPHDAGNAQLSQRGGRSLAAVLGNDYGIKSRIVQPTTSLQWSIQQVRTFLPLCVFDAERCKDGLDKLRQYRRKWDPNRRAYHDVPLHDFCSHAADAFRTGVEGLQAPLTPQQPLVVDYFGQRRQRQTYAIGADDDTRF